MAFVVVAVLVAVVLLAMIVAITYLIKDLKEIIVCVTLKVVQEETMKMMKCVYSQH